MHVLLDIQAVDKESTLKALTPVPVRQPIVYEVEGRQREADLYLPGTGEDADAGVVLVPGLTPRGRADSRLVAFANTLARARFAVIVPDLVAMRSQIATADDAVPIADAICFLSGERPQQALGLVGISFALGPGLLALFEPQADGRVDFVLGVGGYYDIGELITFITTGFVRDAPEQPWRRERHSDFGKYVFLITAARNVENLDDRATLLEIAARKLDDKDANVDDLVARLGAEGMAIHDLLVNPDPDRTHALIESLGSPSQQSIAALDLARRDLRTLEVEFVLVHDRRDPVVPATESVALARAARPGAARVYLVDGLDHANPKSFGVRDATLLIDAIYRILQRRDGGGGEVRPSCDSRWISAPEGTMVGGG